MSNPRELNEIECGELLHRADVYPGTVSQDEILNLLFTIRRLREREKEPYSDPLKLARIIKEIPLKEISALAEKIVKEHQ